MIAEKRTGAGAEKEQYNILIVEDDKEIRDGIEIFLKSQNYNVSRRQTAWKDLR